MSAMLPYLVAPLFFMADYTAPEETLAAGIKGYQQRAELRRKLVIAECEKRAKEASSMLSGARRGRIDATLVGTRNSAGVEANGNWTFGTASERAEMVAALSLTVDAWRQTTAGLKSKKTWPQIVFDFDSGITPGAVGCFHPDKVKRIADERGVAVAIRPAEFVDEGDTPIIKTAASTVFAIVNSTVRDTSFRAIYQFTGTKDGRPVFTLVESLRVGEMELFME